MNFQKTNRQLALSGLLVAALVALDQLTKWLAWSALRGTEGVSLIPGVFELRYLQNESAAFSLDPVSILHKIFRFTYFDAHPDAFLMAKMLFFIILTVCVLVLIAVCYKRLPGGRRFLPMNLILIGMFSGALGNLIDRVLHHYVIDFFYFSLIDFPVFNVADIYVTCAAAALIIFVLFYYKEEDFTFLFRKKKER